MNQLLLFQWLSGLLVIVVIAFPAFFLMNRNFVLRLAVASISVVVFLLFFGAALGSPFSCTRWEDVPPLVLGLGLAWLLAAGGRVLRTQLLSGQIS